jgi:hypothetical protein
MHTSNPAVLAWHMPIRAFSPIDALNRRALSLGSPGSAAKASHADYNGHRVTVAWNNYKRYYTAEYTWAGRVVLARGSFAECFAAAMREHERGALGASVLFYPRPDDLEAHALLTQNAVAVGEAAKGDWYTWRHVAAESCARDSANPRWPVRLFDWELLQAAESAAEYDAALTVKYGRVWG